MANATKTRLWTKAEAKAWACSMAADVLGADLHLPAAYFPPDNDTNHFRAKDAMRELVFELQRRGKHSPD